MKAFRRPHSWCGKFTLAKPTWKMWKAFNTFVQPSKDACRFCFKGRGSAYVTRHFCCFQRDSIYWFYFCKGFVSASSNLSAKSDIETSLSIKLTLDRVNNNDNNKNSTWPPCVSCLKKCNLARFIWSFLLLVFFMFLFCWCINPLLCGSKVYT